MPRPRLEHHTLLPIGFGALGWFSPAIRLEPDLFRRVPKEYPVERHSDEKHQRRQSQVRGPPTPIGDDAFRSRREHQHTDAGTGQRNSYRHAAPAVSSKPPRDHRRMQANAQDSDPKRSHQAVGDVELPERVYPAAQNQGNRHGNATNGEQLPCTPAILQPADKRQHSRHGDHVYRIDPGKVAPRPSKGLGKSHQKHGKGKSHAEDDRQGDESHGHDHPAVEKTYASQWGLHRQPLSRMAARSPSTVAAELRRAHVQS